MNIARDTHELILSHDELMLKELERRDGIYSFIFHELETPKPTAAAGATPPATTKQKLAEVHAAELKTVLAAAPALAGPAAPASKQYHEFLRAWQPPASLVYEHPKLYAYMANCGFRVRVATPRFSHISTPLVRNRRHALKDAPEYKRCEMCAFKLPDLRALFPLDPDVHAPFDGAAALQLEATDEQR